MHKISAFHQIFIRLRVWTTLWMYNRHLIASYCCVLRRL